jgi:hypothetical protein
MMHSKIEVYDSRGHISRYRRFTMMVLQIVLYNIFVVDKLAEIHQGVQGIEEV